MGKLIYISFTALVLLVAGCASSGPIAKKVVVGGPNDYGVEPTNAIHFAQTWVSVNLNDPDTVKNLRVVSIQPYHSPYCFENGVGYLYTHSLPRDAEIYGYAIRFYCSSKNAFGTYGPDQLYGILERDGDIIETLP